MARQLAFDLPARSAQGRADFYVSPANADALALIDRPDLWPLGKLLLIGPEGSGKSHLAAVFAAGRQARMVEAADLARGPLPDPAPALVVENADRLPATAQEPLFHLHERTLREGGLLLLTAARPVADWGLTLADLKSRMQGTAAVALSPPDDALLAAVIVKLFADRQVTVAPTLVRYLVERTERSFAAARDLVERLDARALALGRPITRALAADVLDSAAGP